MRSTAEPKKQMLYWDFEEWKKFEDVLDDDIYKLLFQFLYYTGCRIGEALALTFSDFGEDFKTVNISKTVTSKTTKIGYNITPAKTNGSNRDILIPNVLSNCIKKCYSKVKIQTDFNDDLFIFGLMKPLSTTTIERKKNKYCEIANVTRIRIHDFRHSHASFLINNGVAPIAVSSRLGHKSLSTTLDIYSHMFNSQDKAVIDFMNKKLGDL